MQIQRLVSTWVTVTRTFTDALGDTQTHHDLEERTRLVTEPEPTPPDDGLAEEEDIRTENELTRVGSIGVASTADLLRSTPYPGGVPALFGDRPESIAEVVGLLAVGTVAPEDTLVVDGAYVLGTVDEIVAALLLGPPASPPFVANHRVTMNDETTGVAEHAFFGRGIAEDLEAEGLLGSDRYTAAFLAHADALGLSPRDAEGLYLDAHAFAALPDDLRAAWEDRSPYAAAYLDAIDRAGSSVEAALAMSPDLLLSRVESAGGNIWALARPFDPELLEVARLVALPPDVLAAQISADAPAALLALEPHDIWTPGFLERAERERVAPDGLARFARFVAPPDWYAEAAPELQHLYRAVVSDRANSAAFGPSNAGLVEDFDGNGVIDDDDLPLDLLHDLPGRRDIDEAARRMRIVQAIVDASTQLPERADRVAFQATMASAVARFGDVFSDLEGLRFLLARPEIDLDALERFQGSLGAYRAYELVAASADFDPAWIDERAQVPASLKALVGPEATLEDVVEWLASQPDPAAFVAARLADHRAAIALTGDPTQLDRAIDESGDLAFLTRGVFLLAGNPIEEVGLDLVAPVGASGIDALVADIEGADLETLARLLVAGEVKTESYFALMPPFGALVLGEKAQIEAAMDDVDAVARTLVAVAAPYAGIAVASMATPTVLTLFGIQSTTAVQATSWSMRVLGAASFTGTADGLLALTDGTGAPVDWENVALAARGGVIRGAAVPIASSSGHLFAGVLRRLPGLTPRVAEAIGTLFTGTVQGGGQTVGALVANGADLSALTPEERQAVFASLIVSTASGAFPASRAFDDLGFGMLGGALSRYAGEATEEVLQEVFETWAYAMDDADLLARIGTGEVSVDEAFALAADALGSAIADTDYGMLIGTTLLVTTLTGGHGDLDRVRIDLDRLGLDATHEAELGALVRTLHGDVPLAFGPGNGFVHQAYGQAGAVARFLLEADGDAPSLRGRIAGLGSTEAALAITQRLAVTALATRYGIPVDDVRALSAPEFLNLMSSDFWAQRTFRQTSTLPIDAQLEIAADLVAPDLAALLTAGIGETSSTWIDAQRIVATSRADLARIGETDPMLSRDFGSYRIEHAVAALGIDALLNGDTPDLSAQLTTMVLADLYGRARLVEAKATYVAARAEGAPPDPALEQLLTQTSATYLPDGRAPFVLNVERAGALQQIAVTLPATSLASLYTGDAAPALFAEIQAQLATALRTPTEVFTIDADVVAAAYGLGGEGLPLMPADLQLSLRDIEDARTIDPGALTNITGDPDDATPSVVTMAFDGDRVVNLAWRLPHANDAMPMNALIEDTIFGETGVALLGDTATTTAAMGLEIGLLPLDAMVDPTSYAEALAAVPERSATFSLDALLGDERAVLNGQIRSIVNPALRAAAADPDAFGFISEDQLLVMAMTALSVDPDGPPAIGEWLVASGGTAPSGVGSVNPAALPMPASVIEAYRRSLETGDFTPSAERGALLADALALFAHDRAMGFDGATMAARMAHATGAHEGTLSAMARVFDPDRAGVLSEGQFVLGSRIVVDDPNTQFLTALSSRHDAAWGIVGAGRGADKSISLRTTDVDADLTSAGADAVAIYRMIVRDLVAASSP